MTSRWFRAALITAAVAWTPLRVHAHEVRPAFLEITENPNQTIDVLFKQPSVGSLTVRLEPNLSGGLLASKPPQVTAGLGFQTRRWDDLDVGSQGLADRTVGVDGLERSITDALVIVHYQDGNERQEILRPGEAPITLEARGDSLPIKAYLSLGIEHILTGYDHLVFVLGLTLLVTSLGSLIRTVTSFTIAHSITLAASALGIVRFDAPKIEMLVALSIVFVALELVRKHQGRSSLAQQWPWLIAFLFGLLHGSAFAGALAQIGLPTGNIPLALFLFNLGVEIGQLLFVLVILAARPLLARIPWRRARIPARAIELAPAYAIGPLAVYWMFERFHAAVL
jgi:hydrogenase/urease accessory protein HupE